MNGQGFQSRIDKLEIGGGWFIHLAKAVANAFAHAMSSFSGRCGQYDFARPDSKADQQAYDREHDRGLA